MHLFCRIYQPIDLLTKIYQHRHSSACISNTHTRFGVYKIRFYYDRYDAIPMRLLYTYTGCLHTHVYCIGQQQCRHGLNHRLELYIQGSMLAPFLTDYKNKHEVLFFTSASIGSATKCQRNLFYICSVLSTEQDFPVTPALLLKLLAYCAEQGLRNGYASVRPSVCPMIRSPHSASAGLLLWARRTGDID